MMFLLAAAVGMLMPLQTCINTRLRKRLGSPFSAAFVSVLTSMLFIAAVLYFTAGSLRLPFDKLAGEPKWIYIGGLCGVTVMTGNILLFPKLGGVQTVIFPILGQIVTGLLIDAFGLFRGNVTPLTATRLAGALLVFIGVLTASLQHGDRQKNSGAGINLYRLAAVMIGAIGTTQTSINGYFGRITGNPFQTALVSSSVSFLTICVILTGMHVSGRQKLRMGDLKGDLRPWWMWLGGILGALCLSANTVTPAHIGTGMTVIMNLLGSTAMGTLVDHFGWFNTVRRPVSLRKAAGLLIMIIGAGMIRLM